MFKNLINYFLPLCLLFSIILAANDDSLDAAQKKAYDEETSFHPYLRILEYYEMNSLELNTDHWTSKARIYVLSKTQQKRNHNKAKNIILFLGDGMSIHTLTATRTFMGSEKTLLPFEKFPYFGLSKTYCVNAQVPDSACTSTAYLSGVKGNYGTIGVNAQVPRHDCKKGTDKSTYTESIASWAQKAGKATGFVTTARVTHASPAGLYAHTANRDWENDEYVKKDGCNPKENIDIAQQLIKWPVGNKFKVILGGGRGEFRDKSMKDEEGYEGWRTDGKDLIREWKKDKNNEQAEYVSNRQQLLKVDTNKTEYLLGLFSPGHCPFHGDIVRNNRQEKDPTLSEMTKTAIKILQKEKEGFFLFVEGARIDMAHHETKAQKALEDTKEFAEAVKTALDLTSRKDTLIVVTSDHSHTMTINGYQDRFAEILGIAKTSGDDDLPYTSLSYANGPGYNNTYKKDGGGRRDIFHDDYGRSAEYQYMAGIPLKSETHAGEDVGVFASGPRSHYFTGNYEQNVIPILMAYAAEIGPYGTQITGNANCINFSMIFIIKLFIFVKYII